MSVVTPVSPKILTLLMIVQDHNATRRVLLGRKKRGFGAGYYNGFGGKVEKGETIRAAALRELHEEAMVEACDCAHRGMLTFRFDDNPQPWQVHVFSATKFTGTPTETEEMEPKWFSTDQLPFDNMWADDPHWYPLFLQGLPFKGDFFFTNTTTLVEHEVRILSEEQFALLPSVDEIY
mmetsp:Transcript_1569/g.3288  ORF Transcript_1569/g.3288 Transcript_1569/m.3288 type:complete len:178 (+) Transcript_1569:104-637(+)